MNYEKHYNLLCQTRQQLNRQKLPASHPDYVYYELHHIVPRHEAGSDEASNLVLLTAREHFIAHWLFAKWKQTPSSYFALSMMLQKVSNRELTSRQFEVARKAVALAMTGRTVSEETRAKIAAGMTGEKNWCYGKKHSAEHIAKRAASLRGKPKSKEHIENTSKGLKARYSANGHPSIGSKRTIEQKAYIGYCRLLAIQKKNGFCTLQSKENFLALEAYLQYA